jgi:hypothetical protein
MHREFWSDFDSIFGCETPHNQGQLSIGCHSDGHQINTLYIFRGACTSTIHSHNKFRIHGFHKCLRCCRALKEALAMHGHSKLTID